MRFWIKIHVALLLVVPPLLIGGVHTLTHAALGAWACLLAILWSFHLHNRPSSQRTVYIDGWFILFSLAVVITWLQLLPLPVTWWARLSPQTGEIFRRTLGAVGLYHPEHWQPFSLAPPETAAKLLRDVGALVLYFVVLQWAHQRSRLRWMMQIAVLGACAIALLIIGQSILGIRNPLMGLYHPRSPSNLNLLSASPFINSNHMGAYFFFHALLSLPLLVEAESKKPRMLWSGALLLLSLLAALSISRGVVISYAVGLLGFGFVYWRYRMNPSREAEHASSTSAEDGRDEDQEEEHSERRDRRHRSKRRVPVVLYLIVAMGAGLIFAVAIDFGGLRKEFSETRLGWNQDKLGMITGHSKPLLQHYPWLGIGRGAMAMVWHRFADEQTLTRGRVTVTHVESHLIQPLIDWGIPLGLGFVLIGLFLLWLMFRRSKGFLEKSVLVALLALLLQNVGDFNLEYIGTGFPFLAFLAALQRLQSSRLRKKTRPWRWLPATLGVIGLFVIGWYLPYAHRHHFYRLPQRWKQVKNAPDQQFQEKLKELVRHHPSDYMLANLVAYHYTFKNPWEPAQALRWLHRGDYLNPTASDLKILRAYNLARLGLAQQAIREIDRALESRYILVRAAYPILLRFKMLKAALQHSKNLSLVSYILHQLHNMSPRPKGYVAALRQSLKRFPRDLPLSRLFAGQLLIRWHKEQSRKGPEQEEMLQELKKFLRQFPQDKPEGKGFVHLMYGHIARFQGKYRDAIAHYQKVTEGPHWYAFYELFRLYVHQKMYTEARMLLNEVQSRYTALSQKAHIIYLEGTLLQAQGRLRYALQRYEYANQHHANPTYQMAQAHLCWELGQFDCTIRIYRDLVQTTKNKSLQLRLEAYEKAAQQRKQSSP